MVPDGPKALTLLVAFTLAWSKRSLPAFKVVPPVYVLAPDKAQVPAPSLTRLATVVLSTLLTMPPKAPLRVSTLPPPVMLPLKVMLPLLPDTVAAAARVRLLDQAAVLLLLLAKAPTPPAPAPLMVRFSALVMLKPFKSSVPPLATVVPPAMVPKGVPATPSLITPALILVAPL